jgi:hypothetical protein
MMALSSCSPANMLYVMQFFAIPFGILARAKVELFVEILELVFEQFSFCKLHKGAGSRNAAASLCGLAFRAHA